MSESPRAAPRLGRRLLIVHSSADRYGSDVACLLIAAAARNSGWHVDVVLPHAGPLVGDLASAGVGVHVLDPIVLRRADLRGPRALLLPLRWLAATVSLRAWARTRAPYDVVHSNCLPTLGGALLAHWWRAAHVWHVHEILTSRVQRRVYDAALRRWADVVVTCSRSALHQFPGLVASGKGLVAYTGVTVDAGIAVSEVLGGGEPTLVCVSRLNAWKGQQVLVEAVGRLASRGVVVRLQLVGSVFRGETHFEEALRDRIDALGLSDRVELLGERRDALAIVAAGDIAVLATTRPEPFGMAVVEAMALGRPVVASRTGGPAEYIVDGSNGLLVTPGDEVELAEAIARLVSDPEGARRLGVAGRESAAELTTERMTTAVLSAYDAAIARSA